MGCNVVCGIRDLDIQNSGGVLGSPLVCLFPVLIPCLVHGFCPAHSYPDGARWIFAWTPWAGFTLGPERINPAASQTQLGVTSASGTQWLPALLEQARLEKDATRQKAKQEEAQQKAQRKAKQAEAKREAQKKAEYEASATASGRGKCDHCGESFYNLATHTAKACTQRQKQPIHPNQLRPRMAPNRMDL